MALTVGSPSVHRRYSALKHLAFMLLFLLGSLNVWGAEVTDELTQSLTGVTGTNYTSWSEKTSNSDAVYAGQSAGGNSSIQLRSNSSNSGVITTKSGGKVKSVTVEWNTNTSNGRTINIYGKNSAYTQPTELYNTTNQGTLLGTIVMGTSTSLSVTGDYEYIGIRSASGALYLTSISIVWESSSSDPTVLQSIAVGGDLGNKKYETTDKLDLTGLTVTGYYTVGDPQTISSGISWNVRTSEAANDAVALDEYVLTAGQTSVDVQATVDEISSDWVTISGLTVTAPEGDKLTRETTGVTGTSYTDWSEKTVASDAVYAGNSAGGNESIQLRSSNNNSGVVSTTSGGLIKKVKVAWNSNTASGRTLDVYGSNTAYTAASDLYGENSGTLLGTIAYGTSTQLEITGDYEYVGVRSNSGAMYLESITFVWEAGKQLEAIAVKTNPNKLSYNINDEFDATGLVITATYDDSSSEDIAYAGNEDKFSFSGFSSAAAAAAQAITVTYGGESTTFNVEIKDVTLQSVTVGGTPTTTSYTAGDTFDPAGLTVMGHYSDNSDAPITSGITWSYPDDNATLAVDQASIRVVATVDEIASEAYTVSGLTVTAAPLVASWVASEHYNETTDMTAETVAFGPSNNFSIVFGAGTNSNAPKYYTSGEAVRAYGGNTFALSSTGYKFKEIVIGFGSSDGSNAISANVGTYDAGTWTGNSKEVVFTIGGTSGQRRIASITVTYVEAQPSVETPTISPDGGDFITASQTVTITCATDGAEIHYTLDGTDPTNVSATYTEELSLTGTTTVKAIAIKDGMENSAVASATFTKIEVKTVADALSAAVNEVVYVSGTITSITEVNIGYKNATYVISDISAGIPQNEMIVYRGKYIDGADFTSVDQLHVGDVVLVKGTISQHDSKNQLAAGNILQSISAPAVAVPSFTPDGGGFIVSASVSLTCVTTGATIYYTTDGTTPDNTKNAYASAIPLTETTTIKAVAIKNSESSMVVERTFTKTDPMTVAAAYDALDNDDPISDAAVEGIVYKVDRCTADGNAQYWISDDGTESTKVIEIFNGYGLDGANFADADGIQVGDKVIVFGTLKIYYNKNSEEVCREFDSGSRLLSLTRKTVTGVAVTGTPSKTSYKTGQAFEPAGLTVTVTYNDNSHATVAVADCGWEITPATFTEAGTNKSVSVKATYNEVPSPAFAVEGLTVTAAPTFNDPNHEWQLVTSDAQLVAGKYYVIASTDQGKVMSNTISSNVAGEIAATFADGVINYNAFGSSQSADAAGVAVLQLGGEADAWTLTEVVANDALLGATAVKYLAWGNGTTTWSISIASDDATIQNGTASYGRILHNVSNTRFTTYTSNTSVSMLLPQLYVWAEKVYKLRYDANGGENAPAAQPAVAGQATVTNAKPTKEDKIFKEWNTLVGGDGEAKAAGEVIDLSAGDVTLYAQWRDPVPVTVSYDANEGTGEMAADAGQVEGSTYTIKANAFERNGYLFAGWKAYDANDDELEITNGKFTVPATNVTVKAQWQSATDSKWVLVEHLSQLAIGDKVIIAAKESDYALGAEAGSSNKYRAREAANKAGKLLIPTAGATQLTLGKSGDYYTFKDGDNYLMWSSGNTLPTEASVSDNSLWTISFEEGVMHIVNKTDENRQIQYNGNSGQERFATYTGSQQAVVIYKYLDMDPTDEDSGHERVDLVLNGIGTICLPYDVKASDRFGGVFYMPSHKTSGFANFIEETGTLRAGKAYIFVAENEFIRLKYSGDAVSEPLSNVADTRGLIGTFTNIAPGNLTHKYVIANNKLMECGSGAYLNAYRAYLDLDAMPEEALVINDGPGAAPRRRLGVAGNAPDVTTGMENVQGDNVQATKVLINGELFILRGEKMYDAKGQLVK